METGAQPIRKKPILSLQAMRAISCLVVYLYHATNAAPFLSIGLWCISSFFVLSGFVMTLSYWERPPEAGGMGALRFSVRKMRPLFPLHVVMLLFGLLREVLTTDTALSGYAVRLALTVPLLQAWFPGYYQALNSVDWYLSVTLFLYFSFPFLLRFLQKRESDAKNSVLLIIVIYLIQLTAGAFVGRLFPDYTEWFTYCFPLYRLGDFFIGCVLGAQFRNKSSAVRTRSAGTAIEVSILLAAAASWLAFGTVFKGHDWFTNTCLFVPSVACFIFFIAREEGWVSKILVNRFTMYFGGVSAWFYLVHRQVINYVDYGAVFCLSTRLNPWVLAVVAFPVTLLAVRLYLLLQKIHSSKTVK